MLTNLAISDLLMGIYMLLIASCDIYFGDSFPMQAETWRISITCRVAGTLSILSSEASVFFITLISIDRFINIRFPYSSNKLRKKLVIKIITFLWVISFIFAVVPSLLAGTNYKFYDISHVCIGLPLAKVKFFKNIITRSHICSEVLTERYCFYKFFTKLQLLGYGQGLYYAVALFLGLNGIYYFVIYITVLCGDYSICHQIIETCEARQTYERTDENDGQSCCNSSYRFLLLVADSCVGDFSTAWGI